MEHPEQSEKLAQCFHHIRLSGIIIFFRIVFAVLICETAYIGLLGLIVAALLDGQSTRLSLLALWVLHTAKIVLELYLLFTIVLTWAHTRYYLDEHHLVIYRGIFQVQEHIYELQGVRSVDHQESWIGKLLGYGDITLIFGASGYKEEIKLLGISHSRKYERIFSSFLGAEAMRFSLINSDRSSLSR
jgi:uncharacterized membrane protein YdbT with pleckstrin-like domain